MLDARAEILVDRLEARVLKSQWCVETIPATVLAKAFKGEILSQAPGDEPASVMLARLHAEKAIAVIPKAKPGRKPRVLAST